MKAVMFVLAALPTLAVAADGATKAPADTTPKVVKIRAATVYPGDKFYPKALAEKGIQGDAAVIASVGADGKAVGPKIHTSSRSKELDNLAIDYVKNMTFNEKARADRPTLLIPIDFAKDSPKAVLEKTCSEFNFDYAYFKKTFPEKSTTETSVLRFSMNSLIVNLPWKQIALLSKHKDEANQATIATCAEHPTDKFYETYLKSAKSVMKE